jgi:hypothetical protein
MAINDVKLMINILEVPKNLNDMRLIPACVQEV